MNYFIFKMEEKYKKFKEYNWENSKEWHSYYGNIYPTPPPNKILRYKKKFYRNKIDPDFDIEYSPTNEKEENNHQNSNSNGTNTNSNNNTKSNYYYSKNSSTSLIKTPLLNIETILMILLLFSLPLKYNTKFISIICFLIRSIRLVGKPKYDLAYLKQLLKNESFQTVIFSIEILFDKFNYFLLVPIIISTVVALSENIKLYQLNISSINNMNDLIYNKKEDILQDKSDIELGIVLALFIGIFLNINSMIIFIIHIQVLYIKYFFDYRLQRSFNKLNTYVNNFKNGNNCPPFIKNIIEKIQSFLENLIKR